MKPKPYKPYSIYSKIDNLKDKMQTRYFIEEIVFSESNKFDPPIRKLNFKEFFGKTTLITGESEKGKTYTTACFLNYIIQNVLNASETSDKVKVFVIDMAPQRFTKNGISIGGKIIDILQSVPSSQKITYMDIQNIIPPRFNSKTADEAVQLSKNNYDNIIPHLNRVYSELKKQKKTLKRESLHNIVIINDLSIFLHHGSPKNIVKLMKLKNGRFKLTLFMNSYEGTALLEDHGSGVSEKEKNKVRLIKNNCDFSIELI